MMTRYRWTLDQHEQPTRSGLATENELIEILAAAAMPCVMPSDWLFATMLMDFDEGGLAAHESVFDPAAPWTLQLQRIA
ncbi:hypothetical protein ACU8NT_16540 [Rhizobium leguminosarum]